MELLALQMRKAIAYVPCEEHSYKVFLALSVSLLEKLTPLSLYIHYGIKVHTLGWLSTRMAILCVLRHFCGVLVRTSHIKKTAVRAIVNFWTT